MLDDVDTAVRLAQESFAAGDKPTGRVLVAAARSRLGAIDERFQLPGADSSHAILREADADLKAIEHADTASSDMFRNWRRQWPARAHQLQQAEPRSLFSEAVLRRMLAN
jgi:hypothetical protein